jgi:phosphatidate cytidylyltransferase
MAGSESEEDRRPNEDDDAPRYVRPWEREPDGDQEAGEETMPEISEELYLAATTHEYRGLAEEMSQAESEPVEKQAIAATLGTGLVGFEDVTGRRGVSEVDVEHEEQARASDLTVRVVSALVLIGMFVGTLLLSGWWFTLFVAAVMVVSVGEFYATIRRRDYAPLALVGLLGAVAVVIGVHVAGVHTIPAVLAVTVIATFLFFSVVSRRNPADNAALTVFGLAWVAPLAFAAAIGRSLQSVSLVLMVVGLVALFDMGAYFIGRSIGRHALAPVLSPKKTVEGLIGGVVMAAAAAAIVSTIDFFPVSLVQALVLALIISVLAPLGDGAESMVKRALGEKDMGSLIPGHGGMLDRIDGLLLTVPAAYFFFDAINVL